MIDFVMSLQSGDYFLYREGGLNAGKCEMIENRSTKDQIDVSIRILAEKRTVDICCGPSGAYLGATFLPIEAMVGSD